MQRPSIGRMRWVSGIRPETSDDGKVLIKPATEMPAQKYQLSSYISPLRLAR